MSENTANIPALTLEEEAQRIHEEFQAGRDAAAAKATVGTRFAVPREGLAAVDTILYRPARDAGKAMPVFFNLHGGGWIGGDATLMESFCQLLADELGALVVNVNYKKADVQPLPYPQQELRDAVLYFAAHAGEYGIDPARMAVGGHSAGAHIAAGAAMLLRQAGFALAAQLLVYPAVDMTERTEKVEGLYGHIHRWMFANGGREACWASPLFAADEELRGLAPVLGILCGLDSLRPQGLAYFEKLAALGVPVQYKEYPGAHHGFLEVNRPDYPADERQTPDQAAMARDAEKWIAAKLGELFA